MGEFVMQAIRRILVAVKDPSARSLPAVKKAAQLARATGAQLELFHGLAQTVLVDAVTGGGQGLRRYEADVQAKAVAQLEKIADQVRRHKVDVLVAAEWDHPPSEAVVRRALKTRADLIVAERHAGRRIAGAILSYTDWDLLRLAPCPVLVVKSTKPYLHPAIVAAVDPLHTHAKPAKLDTEILKAAATLKSTLRGSLTIVHAYPPPVVVTGAWVSGPVVTPIGSTTDTEKTIRKALDEELERLPMPPHKVAIVCGPAREVIPDQARRAKAGIVVMGVMSRSGLKRFFVGNTAETVLDALPCDVLVIKPGRFKTPVPRGSRGPQLMTIPMTTAG
jgi:universal stress protein E